MPCHLAHMQAGTGMLIQQTAQAEQEMQAEYWKGDKLGEAAESASGLHIRPDACV